MKEMKRHAVLFFLQMRVRNKHNNVMLNYLDWLMMFE